MRGETTFIWYFCLSEKKKVQKFIIILFPNIFRSICMEKSSREKKRLLFTFQELNVVGFYFAQIIINENWFVFVLCHHELTTFRASTFDSNSIIIRNSGQWQIIISNCGNFFLINLHLNTSSQFGFFFYRCLARKNKQKKIVVFLDCIRSLVLFVSLSVCWVRVLE